MKACLIWAAVVGAGLSSLAMLASRAPAAGPQATSQPTTAADEATADEVIKSLLMDRPKTTVQPTEAPATEPATQSTTVAPSTLLKPIETSPGTVIVNRLGRLVKDPNSDWWIFHFESDGASRILRDPPLRILPNRQLEAMEQTNQDAARTGVKFRVSGEVMEYRQQKYLLLRNWLVERDMGQL